MTDKSKPTKGSSETGNSSSSPQPNKNHNALKKEVMTGQTQERPQQRRDTRFKKGQSGNPSGRPRKNGKQNSSQDFEPSIDKILLEFANQELTVKSGDTTVRMTGEQALIQSQYKSALGGNVHATKDLLTRTERAGQNKQMRQAERANGWREYKAHYTAQLQQMRERDEEFDENLQLPHPDDIDVSWDNVVTFKGALDKEQLERCYETVKFRDTLILQSELDRRESVDLDDQAITGAHIMASLMDNTLPARMKLTDNKWIDAMEAADRMTKRHLLKELLSSWDEILRGKAGYKPGSTRRGTHFPGKEAIKLLYTDLQEYCSNLVLSDEPPSQDEIDDLCDIIMSAKAAFADVNA